jgi:hypothetical protein
MIPISECRISGTLTCNSSMLNNEYIEISNGECKNLPAGKCKDSSNNLSTLTLETDPNYCIDTISFNCLNISNGIC